jgi:DNA-binding transcriptional LysR family regulator
MDLLAQMITFMRVLETGSLSAAARTQKLSLPAVSRQLSALESDLGTSLVARSTRRLHATEAGTRFYEHCQRVLREVDEARSAVSSSAAVRGTLVVSAGATVGTRFVLPSLEPLLRRHPQLRVELRLEDRVVDLIADAVDVAFRAGVPPPDSAALVVQRVLLFKRVVVAAPKYLRAHGLIRVPEELARHACLVQLGDAGALDRWELVRDGDGQTCQVTVRGRLKATLPSALLELARGGFGVALLPEWLVAADLQAKRLRRVLPSFSSAPISAYALYRTSLRGSPRVRAFLEALASVGESYAVHESQRGRFA